MTNTLQYEDAAPLKWADVKAGTTVIVDGGFGCLQANSTHVVEGEPGGYYIKCGDGRHYLDGQLDFTSDVASSDDRLLVGVRAVKAETTE